MALLLWVGCPTAPPDTTCHATDAPAELPASDAGKTVIAEPWAVYTCTDFPANDLGLGTPCQEHTDCPGAGEQCVWGIVPCETGQGRCTTSCRMDLECHTGPIDFDTPPPLVCVVAADQLSVCLPSSCLPRITGWHETCGPLSGEPVNELGLGKECHSQAECAGQVANQCPSPNAPEPHCTMPCESDADCGSMGACVCVDNPECTEQFFFCAPTLDCAEAVRHHHCRGPGIPPRDHEMPCGSHPD